MHINNMEKSCTILHSAKLTMHLNIDGWVTFTAGTRYLFCRCMLSNSRDIHRDGGSSNQHLHVFTGSCLEPRKPRVSKQLNFQDKCETVLFFLLMTIQYAKSPWSISSLISERELNVENKLGFERYQQLIETQIKLFRHYFWSCWMQISGQETSLQTFRYDLHIFVQPPSATSNWHLRCVLWSMFLRTY